MAPKSTSRRGVIAAVVLLLGSAVAAAADAPHPLRLPSVNGQDVKQGELLFVIDPRPYEATLAAAQAQLDTASAQVELAQRQLARSGELRKKDFEPASSYDQRVSEFKMATAAATSAKAAIRSAELNVEFTHIKAPVSGRG